MLINWMESMSKTPLVNGDCQIAGGLPKDRAYSGSQGVGSQDIALHGDAVSVPADHLIVGFQAFLNGEEGGGPARHPDDSGLVIGDVYRICDPFEMARFFPDRLHIGSLGGPSSAVKAK